MSADDYYDFLPQSQLGDIAKELLALYVALALDLPGIREQKDMMQAEVKTTSSTGIQDVATNADKYMQRRIKESVLSLRPGWQFWGEEGEDNVSEFDNSKSYMLITDPIEGTNNFINHIDDQWGSVLALVDVKTTQPVIGIVAHPTKGLLYLGIKDGGAYILEFDKTSRKLLSHRPMPKACEPQYAQFTYNNSPHFSQVLAAQATKFLAMGEVLPDKPGATELMKSRQEVVLTGQDGQKVHFIDPESGALEAIRNRGTVYFKTSNEMAAVFVLLEEIGGKVTDGKGNPWSFGINTMVSARTIEDYDYLMSLYRKCL